jgi:hypothetical protein
MKYPTFMVMTANMLRLMLKLISPNKLRTQSTYSK